MNKDINIDMEKIVGKAFEVTNTFLSVIDVERRVLRCTSSTATFLNMTQDELVGKDICQLISGDEMPDDMCSFERMKRTVKRETEELDFRGKCLRVTVDPLLDESGKLQGAVHIIQDVTLEKKLMEDIKLKKEKAESYLSIATVMIVAIDKDGIVTLINKEGCDILGYEESEVIGKNWFDTFLPEHVRGEIKHVSDRVLTGEFPELKYFENPVLTKSGEERMMMWHNAVLRDREGRVTGHLSSGQDITERRKMEQEARDKAFLLDASSAIITKCDLDGSMGYVNPAFLKNMGFDTPDEVLGRPLTDFWMMSGYHDEIMAELQGDVGKGRWEGELQMKRKDGTLIDAYVSAATVYGDDDRPCAMMATSIDITETKKAWEGLRHHEQMFKTITESSRDLIALITFDPQVTYIYVNPPFEKLLGYRPEELVGKSSLDLLYPEDKKRMASLLREYLVKKTSGFFSGKKMEAYERAEYRLRKKTGGWCDLEGIITVSGDNLVLVSRDITQRKAMEQKIRHLNRVLMAVRGVNQLITRESDLKKLMSGVSKYLVESGAYENAWISVFDDTGDFKFFARGKVKRDFPEVKRTLEKGGRLRCQEMALKEGGLVEITDPSRECKGCDLASKYGGVTAFCAPLARDGKVYGTLTVSLPEFVVSSGEERALLIELAGDLSFALYTIERSKAEKVMQEEREKHLHELKVFYDAAIGREERILELKNEVESLREKLKKTKM